MGLMPSDEEIRIAITALANTKDAIKNIQALEKSLGITKNAADRMRMATTGAVSPKLADEAIKAKRSLDDLNKTVDKTNKGFSSMINVVKGAVTAMLTLAALRKISEFFTGALDSAKEFRAQMVQLNFSEVILSKKGMDITRKELDDFISEIESKYVYLSKLDATKVVSETAGAVQEFDVSKDQLKALSDSIAYIQLQNKLLGREEADAAHIINAAMDARSNFFNGMGINITETIVKEKAYKLGLVEVGEELTKQQRFQAILALLTEQTSGKQEELIKALEGTPLGNQLALQKEYADTLEKVGEELLKVKDSFVSLITNINEGGTFSSTLIDIFSNLSDGLITLNQSISDAYDTIEVLNGSFEDVAGGAEEAVGWIKQLGSSVKWVIELIGWRGLVGILQSMGAVLGAVTGQVAVFFEMIKNGAGVPEAAFAAGKFAGEIFLDGMDKALNTVLGNSSNPAERWIREQWAKIRPEAPSKRVFKEAGSSSGSDAGASSMADGVEDEADDTKKAVEKMHEEVLDEYLKMQQDIEDATVDFNRKMDDISSEYQFKRLDENQNYSNKVADINRDGNRKLQDISAKHAQSETKARQDNLDKEREYQNKLLEMRENFLMDLDDALHARDARQILKLIKQFNLDKTQAQRQRDLQKQEQAGEAKLRQQAYEAERKDAEIEKRRKLEDAAIAHQEKLAQLAEEESRERLQAQLDYQRKLQDLETNMRQRLALMGAGLVAEFNLTKQGLDAVLALYQAYYGPGGAVEAIYQGMMQRLSTQQPVSPTTAAGTNQADPQSQAGGYGHDHGKGYSYKFAEGGSLIANKPTSILMAEKGPEVATFTPLNRTGRDVNKVFSNMSGGNSGSGGGQLLIEVGLSPDLEARVVNNAIQSTANVIARVVKTKG